jgi:hypothetical protein
MFLLLSTIGMPVPVSPVVQVFCEKGYAVIDGTQYFTVNKTMFRNYSACQPIMEPGSSIGYLGSITTMWSRQQLSSANLGMLDSYIIKPWYDKFALEQMAPLMESIRIMTETINRQTKRFEIHISPPPPPPVMRSFYSWWGLI